MVDIALVDLVCFTTSRMVAMRMSTVNAMMLRPKFLNNSRYRSTKLLAKGRISTSVNMSPMISNVLP